LKIIQNSITVKKLSEIYNYISGNYNFN
jgi:hypothetical protein